MDTRSRVAGNTLRMISLGGKARYISPVPVTRSDRVVLGIRGYKEHTKYGVPKLKRDSGWDK